MFKPTAQTAFWRGKDLASRMYTRRKRATFPGGAAVPPLQRFKLAAKAVRQFVVTHRIVAKYIEQERRRPLLPERRAHKRRRSDGALCRSLQTRNGDLVVLAGKAFQTRTEHRVPSTSAKGAAATRRINLTVRARDVAA